MFDGTIFVFRITCHLWDIDRRNCFNALLQGYLRNHHPHTQRLFIQEVRGSRSQPNRVENYTSAEQCKTFKRRGLRLKHQEVVMFERFQA